MLPILSLSTVRRHLSVLTRVCQSYRHSYVKCLFFSGAAPSTTAAAPTVTQSFGVTDAQRDDAYAQWLNGLI